MSKNPALKSSMATVQMQLLRERDEARARSEQLEAVLDAVWEDTGGGQESMSHHIRQQVADAIALAGKEET